MARYVQCAGLVVSTYEVMMVCVDRGRETSRKRVAAFYQIRSYPAALGPLLGLASDENNGHK